MRRARQPAAQCTNNLRQLGLAHHAYLAAHGAFVPGCLMQANSQDPTAPTFGPSACTLLLPFLEQAAIASLYDYGRDAEDWFTQDRA